MDGLKKLEEYTPTIDKNAPSYNQSQQVIDAYNKVNQHQQNKPGEYQSQYQNQIDQMVNNILNRPKFEYDMNHDPLYQQYKQQYVSQGQKAMRDTQGQAAMLSGGYGNSYATAAGNQSYNDYLSKLNAMVPQLQQNARQFYNEEGDKMYKNVGLMQGLEDGAYGRYRDTVGDWRSDRDYYTQVYGDEYGRDYGRYQDTLGQWNSDRDYIAQMARAQQEQSNWEREFAYRQQQDALAAARAASGGGGGRRGGGGGSKSPAEEKKYILEPKKYPKGYVKPTEAPSMWFDTLYAD